MTDKKKIGRPCRNGYPANVRTWICVTDAEIKGIALVAKANRQSVPDYIRSVMLDHVAEWLEAEKAE